jgi:hypothetical protein
VSDLNIFFGTEEIACVIADYNTSRLRKNV